MKIAYIAAGAAGMYCGTCLHDNTLAAALQKKGHDVALIPTYTPIRTDERSVSMGRVFFGGLNVYLQQKLWLFRHTPRFLDRLLDSPALLRWVSRFSTSTNARELGELTVSVLRGENGHQRKELSHLVAWLRDDYRPDIVTLTNSMFVGFAREMKKALGVPVLCALQGEDIFLEDLVEPYKSTALGLLQERAQDVDGFIAPCRYYADFMAHYMGVDPEKIHVVKLGLNLDGHGQTSHRIEHDNPFAIGYLARICPEKGLHILVDAFYELTRQVGADKIRLKVAGYLGKRDEAYFKRLTDRIAGWGLTDAFEHWGEVDREQKIAFLNGLHVLSVPTTYKESKGLYVLEALANGVPVVQPQHGAFPEFIEATGGGVLVSPDSPKALAEGILKLIHDKALRESLGQRGKAVVHERFGDDVMAEATLAVYRKYAAAFA